MCTFREPADGFCCLEKTSPIRPGTTTSMKSKEEPGARFASESRVEDHI